MHCPLRQVNNESVEEHTETHNDTVPNPIRSLYPDLIPIEVKERTR